jgi:CheY-like chemotaxis protein
MTVTNPPLSPTIMVVDDEKQVRRFLRMVLEEKGYQVVEASNGLDAMDNVQRERPDLILMDLNMPMLNGLETTRCIHKHSSLHDVPIVLISGYDSIEFRTDALRAGCCGYLTKPIDVDQLGQLLGYLVPINRNRVEEI